MNVRSQSQLEMLPSARQGFDTTESRKEDDGEDQKTPDLKQRKAGSIMSDQQFFNPKFAKLEIGNEHAMKVSPESQDK